MFSLLKRTCQVRIMLQVFDHPNESIPENIYLLFCKLNWLFHMPWMLPRLKLVKQLLIRFTFSVHLLNRQRNTGIAREYRKNNGNI